MTPRRRVIRTVFAVALVSQVGAFILYPPGSLELIAGQTAMLLAWEWGRAYERARMRVLRRARRRPITDPNQLPGDAACVMSFRATTSPSLPT